jgi:hypothetical protein
MKKHLIFYIFLLLQFLSINAQEISLIPNYDELSKMEEMEYSGGITFYIEKKSENIIAVQNGYIKWKADLKKKCGYRNKRVKVTSVFTQSKKLKVTFSKNKVALINIENGEIECLPEN